MGSEDCGTKMLERLQNLKNTQHLQCLCLPCNYIFWMYVQILSNVSLTHTQMKQGQGTQTSVGGGIFYLFYFFSDVYTFSPIHAPYFHVIKLFSGTNYNYALLKIIKNSRQAPQL